ncbi:MAG TPA: peptide chain release factor N(5)-glutamine methyltransferase [Beijerinckiaceae bacterium]|nr:peptide chain release factor N(5)-glutamine methyltransferase [Beijerinckiaceae bacterium]
MTNPWMSDPSHRASPARRDRAHTLRRNQTEPEKRLWWHLRHRLPLDGTHFRRQVPIGPYFADFCCQPARLIVEVDGNQHGFDEEAARDARRTEYLNTQGYRVLRFSNAEVVTSIDVVLDTILAALRTTTPTPTPLRKGEGNAHIDLAGGKTRAEALALLYRTFAKAGLDTPDLDARLLLADALQVDAVEIAVRPHRPLGPEAAARLAGFARRRLAREPIGRILGRREFWSLPFALSPETLEPRPETETVVETALSLLPDRQAGLRILDLGTGSGCLLVALLHELPHATGLGIDRSPGALAIARANAMRNGVGGRAAFVASDWAAALNARFDLIVSNPPYIPAPDVAGLAPEVREHDPRAALDGGDDGLAAYRTIFSEAAAVLALPGTLVVEIGSGQEQPVRELAEARDLRVVALARDLGGRPRALALTRANL